MKNFEQLAINGSKADYTKALEKMDGLDKFRNVLKAFYEKNKKYNPRQLSLILKQEVYDIVYDLDFDDLFN